MDLNRFREDDTKIHWSEVFTTAAVDEKLNVVSSILTKLCDVYTLVRPVPFKHLPAPRQKAEIGALQDLKNKAIAQFKYDPSSSNKRRTENFEIAKTMLVEMHNDAIFKILY